MIALVRKFIIGKYGEMIYCYKHNDGEFEIRTSKGVDLITKPLYKIGEIVGYEIINLNNQEVLEVSIT